MRVKLFRRGDLVRHTLWRDQLGLITDINPPQISKVSYHVEVQWLETSGRIWGVEGLYLAQNTLVMEDLVEKVT
tara:strand:- start:199 stop:420 length:222 start_codon:yes stop_codon:yes gene_type:complete